VEGAIYGWDTVAEEMLAERRMSHGEKMVGEQSVPDADGMVLKWRV
jgi:hypothetical protein